jgi:hypothetical protein
MRDQKEIYQALIEIEDDCKYRDVKDGYTETLIDTDKFYNRVRGLILLLKQDDSLKPKSSGIWS